LTFVDAGTKSGKAAEHDVVVPAFSPADTSGKGSIWHSSDVRAEVYIGDLACLLLLLLFQVGSKVYMERNIRSGGGYFILEMVRCEREVSK